MDILPDYFDFEHSRLGFACPCNSRNGPFIARRGIRTCSPRQWSQRRKSSCGHILPNTFGYVIVRATLLIPAYILGEVALSFLGVGIQEPIPSWGNMLSAAQSVRVLTEFTWALAPGFFLFLAVLAFNFLGDGLRDALDPRSRITQ